SMAPPSSTASLSTICGAASRPDMPPPSAPAFPLARPRAPPTTATSPHPKVSFVMPAMTEPEIKLPTDLVSPERAQQLLPKLTDEQLATLRSYGVTEQTSVGQVLATAGDLIYDLIVVLEGEVECSDIYDGRRRALLVHGPRDFIAELDLLTGQRLFATFLVTRAGSILRVPRADVKSIIEVDGSLGDLLVQTLFRRREVLVLLRSGMQLIGSRYSPDTQRLREFAARNRLVFLWLDLDNDSVAPALL